MAKSMAITMPTSKQQSSSLPQMPQPKNNTFKGCWYDLTHWSPDTMVIIFQTFSWMKTYEFRLKISLKLVLKGPTNNIPALVQIMGWRRSGDKPLYEPMIVSSLTHICVTRPQCVKKINVYRFVYPLLIYYIMILAIHITYFDNFINISVVGSLHKCQHSDVTWASWHLK